MTGNADDERYWPSESTSAGASLRLARGLRSRGRKGKLIAWLWLALIGAGLIVTVLSMSAII